MSANSIMIRELFKRGSAKQDSDDSAVALPDVRSRSSKQAPSSFSRFVAQTRFGEIGLTVHTPGAKVSPDSALDRAICLQAVEPQIQIVENWLGVGLDCQPHEEGSMQSATLSLTSRGADKAQLMLHVPADRWIELPELTAAAIPADVDTQLRWAKHPARIELGKLELSGQDVLAIGDGAVVLIPGSFQDNWQTSIVVDGGGLQIDGSLEGSGLVWTSNSQQQNQPAEVHVPKSERNSVDIACGALLFSNTRLNVDQLMGEHDSPLSFKLGGESGQLRSRLKMDNGLEFVGCIAPVGGGYGLFIDQANKTAKEEDEADRDPPGKK